MNVAMTLLTNSYEIIKNYETFSLTLKRSNVTLKIQLMGKLMASLIPKKCTKDQRTVAIKFKTTTNKKKCEDPL